MLTDGILCAVWMTEMARILLVEDECDLLDVLRDILTKVRHEVFCASGARDALVMYRAHQPDLVITDIFLPDESGLNLILELTRTSTRNRFRPDSSGRKMSVMTRSG